MELNQINSAPADQISVGQTVFAKSIISGIIDASGKLERVDFNALNSEDLNKAIYELKKVQIALEEVRDYRLLHMAYINKQ